MASLPDSLSIELIDAKHIPAAEDPIKSVQAALEHAGDLERFRGASSVAIAINDKTRPVPHQILLPPLLERLEQLGLQPDDIHLIIAVGTHPPMAPDEYSSILPADIRARYPISSHDARDRSNLVFCGETNHGTPVWLNRLFASAGLRIVIGNIEPHQFVGFSGGVKSAAIGLAGFETIQRNHALMAHPDSRIGTYESNPARQDVEEIGTLMKVDFALNAVLNHERQIVHALAGEPVKVMQAGVVLSKQVCQVEVSEPFDLMIVSPGGHPKDINVYQAQKGLAHAALVTKSGGTVILAAACPEGSGSHGYENWMQGVSSYADVLKRYTEEGFSIGPHKAWQIARDASRVHLLTVSDLDPDFARFLLLNPVDSLQQAIDLALADLPATAQVGILPHAASTIPGIRRKEW